ncbi:MAG TPA: hypothetical protein VFL77_11280 [Solirubrobacterales bacterium]|nr:hypothetical protein [Solirubrobacterales bacterium]
MSRLRTLAWSSVGLLACFLFGSTAAASAAGPVVSETAATDLQGTSALLVGKINPSGQPTSYHFEYVEKATFEADQPNGFAEATSTTTGELTASGEDRGVSTAVSGLATQTAYEFRLVAANAGGIASSGPLEFTTTQGFGFLSGEEGLSIRALNLEEPDVPDSLAGSHPFSFVTSAHFRLAGESQGQPGVPVTDGDLKNFEVDLPPGLFANPLSLPTCSQQEFHTPRESPYEESASSENCNKETQVGVITIETSAEGGSTRTFGVFNLDPPPGYPAQLGFNAYGAPVALRPSITESNGVFALRLSIKDFPQRFDLYGFRIAIWGVPWEKSHDGQRGDCLNELEPRTPYAKCPIEPRKLPGVPESEQPKLEPKPYLTLPTSCAEPMKFTVRATSWQQPGVAKTAAEEPETLQKCNELGFEPQPTGRLSLSRTTSPTGFDFTLTGNAAGLLLPQGRARSETKNAVVSLAEGVTINPSLGAGLGVCTPAEYAAEASTSEPVGGCPNSSKIGEVTIESPLIKAPIRGSVFIAEPDDRATTQPGAENPFDTLIAIYMIARSPQQGLVARAPGEIVPDHQNGQLVARFANLPQLPYSLFNVHFRDGQRSPLATPAKCGIYYTSLDVTSWLSDDEHVRTIAPFQLDSGIGGGPCPGDVEPFNPQASAGTLNRSAGAYTPFYLHLTRTDAEQEITSYSAELPPGLLGKVAGIPYCSDAEIAAAKEKTGAEEAEHPSCPAASHIGHTVSGYGLGSDLAYATGGLYMAGPYGGQPFSVVAIDSANVGPFDLGVVVVRSAIDVNPLTAQVSIDSAASDPIPHILDGIPIHLRDIRVYIDRPNFMLNPTNCSQFTAFSTLTGAGQRLSDPSDDVPAAASYPFQVSNCSALGFKPRLSLRLKGGKKRGDFPSLTATYNPRPGDANLREASVTMPPTAFLAQTHLRSICTRAQFAQKRCPPDSVYGQARAVTPLLAEPLEGPVYLRSSSNPLPDLVADLHGASVSVEVVGQIDSKNGGLRARFKVVPDAPVSSFVMHLNGGPKGLIENATDSICKPLQHASAEFIGQNNRGFRMRPALVPVGCHKHRHRHKHHHRHKHKKRTGR